MAQVTTPGALPLLLDASHRRQIRHSASWTVGIAVLGLLNLIACAYLEQFIGARNAPDGFMLFLAVESGFLLLTGAAVVNTELEIIARKTRVLPVTAAQRYNFVILSLARHKAMQMIAGTGLFAVGILGPTSPLVIAGRVGMTALLMLLIFALMSTLTILRVRPGASGGSIMAITGLVLAGLVVFAAVMSPGPILQVLYPLRWTMQGVLAIQHGMVLPALRYAAGLLLLAGACVFLGRRYA